ncbi:hypothetical protein FACS1894195_5180 [Bacteroidia bacterium]|nr:hypothetical protein FACS1894195_5180 [Bacteroidia bacterium]
MVLFDFENGLAADGRWNGVGQESEEADFGKFYEVANSAENYWWFAENWMAHPTVSGKSDYVVKAEIRLRTDIPVQTAEVRFFFNGVAVNILPYLEVGGVWTTGGDWKTITIELDAWAGLSDPTPASGAEWGMTTWQNSVDFTGFCVDNIRYEHK